jgi:hypothetical protein
VIYLINLSVRRRDWLTVHDANRQVCVLACRRLAAFAVAAISSGLLSCARRHFDMDNGATLHARTDFVADEIHYRYT